MDEIAMLDVIYGKPDVYDRLDQIRKFALKVDATEEDFRIWDYQLSLVRFNYDTKLVNDYMNIILKEMMELCPKFSDYMYSKYFNVAA